MNNPPNRSLTAPRHQLAIETTGRHGSIAILREGDPVYQVELTKSERAARVLAGEIETAVAWAKEQSGNDALPFDFVSVADGPGSFTGLRIGVTTAKTLAYAWQIPLVNVDSLSAIAAEAFRIHADADDLLVAIDAYRGQTYAAEIRRADLVGPHDRIEVLTHETLDTRVQSHAGHFAGDDKLFDSVSADRVLSRDCDAIGVGIVASESQPVDAMELLPRYIKLSAAEEKLS